MAGAHRASVGPTRCLGVECDWWNECHEANHPLSHYHLHRPNTCMRLRNPFSGLKKKLKRRLARGKHEPETGGTDACGEGADGTDLLLQPEPNLKGEDGHNHPQSGNEADVDGERVGSADPLPHSDDPGSVPASESGHGGGEREGVIEGREAGEGGLRLRFDIEAVRPSQEGNSIGEERVNRADPSPTESAESTTTYWSLPPTASSDKIHNPAIPDRVRQVLSVNEGGSGAVDGSKSAASATAKSFLRAVKESENAYPPLKYVAEGLYFILNNCEVGPLSPRSIHNTHSRSSERR